MKKILLLVLWPAGFGAAAQNAARYDVVIDEIMADPSPPAGLPAHEFIELKNTARQSFNLNGWHVENAVSTASISVDFILQPDSFVVICATSAVSDLLPFGATIGVRNFPALDNNSSELWLRSKEGSTIHAVAYRSAWYHNALKAQGGWSLEMIDPHNPCTGSNNWAASNDPLGGTPGKKNSVDAINADFQGPALAHAFASDSLHVLLTFNEPLDSLQAATAGHYSISDGIGTTGKAEPLAPFFSTVALTTTGLLSLNKVYTITVTNTRDCAGNLIGADHTVKLGRASAADTSNLVINELLFNPKPDGSDYLELYNRSPSVVNLRDCYISSRSASGSLGMVKPISTEDRLFFPGEYLVITEDAEAVERQYLVRDPLAIVVMASMPSFADDKGDAVLLNAQGNIVDELKYDEHWQFKLLASNEGVALERIDYNKPTQDENNWHSAASSSGFGTPGYQNSQFNKGPLLPGSITATPDVFSPDNDGYNDFLTIAYHFPEPGNVCNITIFDAGGRPVKYLTHNALCGAEGYFRWDGLDDGFRKIPVGVYIIYTDLFNVSGRTSHFKQAVTLARRL